LEDIEHYRIDQKKQGRPEATWKPRVRLLKQLLTLTDITDPESVKLFLSDEKRCSWAVTTKLKAVDTYGTLLKFKHVQWEAPKYKKIDKLPFLPTEKEIDILIACCGRTTATVLQMLKETGMRIGELCRLKWTDLVLEKKTITVSLPEKGSNPRTLEISDKLIGMLNTLPRIHGENIFQPDSRYLRDYFCTQRKMTAEKETNPRLLQISFKTFRHWKGTTLYHDTRDLMEVKYQLGHKSIRSTEIYIHISKSYYTGDSQKWFCIVVRTEEELINAVNSGFELVAETKGDFPRYFQKHK
jgi:integrase